MEIKTEQLKQMCSKISGLVNPVDSDKNTRLIVLAKNKDSDLFRMRYCNDEYSVEVSCTVSSSDSFNVSVDYEKFCKVVSCLSCDELTITPTNTELTISTGTGKFTLELTPYTKVPFDYNTVSNTTFNNEFKISAKNISAICKCNLREIEKSGARSAVQKYVYFDNKGAISYTLGACVTNFDNDCKYPFLVHNRFVKLFKAFDGDSDVTVKTAIIAKSSEISQMILSVANAVVSMNLIIDDNTALIKSGTITGIRTRATEIYPYDAVISKNDILRIINLISIIRRTPTEQFNMDFGSDSFSWYNNDSFKDTISYKDSIDNIISPITFRCDIDDLKKSVSSYDTDTITVRFGSTENRCIVMVSDNITNIIPKK